MKKIVSFILIILLFGLLFGLPNAKVSATNPFDAVFTDNTNSDVPGRSLQNIPIFGGEGGGGLFGAFGEGATGLLKVIEQINFLALIIGAGLLFISLFLCIFGIVHATLTEDPRGITEARTGLITCFISLGLINMVPIILGIIYQMEAGK